MPKKRTTTVRKHKRRKPTGGYTEVREHQRQLGLMRFAKAEEDLQEEITETKVQEEIAEKEREEKEREETELSPEILGIPTHILERQVAKENLVQSEAYKKWRKLTYKRRRLQEKLSETEDPKKRKEIQEKLREIRAEAEQIYGQFRVIIDDEIISEDKEWQDEFYDSLSESERYNFVTVDQLNKEKDQVETKINPFFNTLFTGQEDREDAPIRIELSPNGDKVYLQWDNFKKDGDLKTDSRDYEKFLKIVRDEYDGLWDSDTRQFIIDADNLENILETIDEKYDKNFYHTNLSYYIDGEFDDKEDWISNANIQKEIIIDNDTDNLIFNISGNKVSLMSGADSEFERKEQLNVAVKALNSAFKVKKRNDDVELPVTKENGEYSFRIGMLSKAYKFLRDKHDFDVAVADSRPRNPISNPELRNYSLYNFQKKAVLESAIEGDGLIVAPTGTGKTVMAGGIISAFLEGAEKYEEKTGNIVDTDTLFLVHRTNLVDQTAEEFEEMLPDNVRYGTLKGSGDQYHASDTPYPDVNLALIQNVYASLRKKLEKEEIKELMTKYKNAETNRDKRMVQMEMIEFFRENDDEKDLLFAKYDDSYRRKQYEKSTGKNAVWSGKLTNGYAKWLKKETGFDEDNIINISTIDEITKALEKKKKGLKLNKKDKKNLNILHEAELIFQDEAHHITAKSYDTVFDQNKTCHKFGMTATPSRTKQAEISRIMRIGGKRIPITYYEAQQKGYLMKPKVVEFPIPTSEKYKRLKREMNNDPDGWSYLAEHGKLYSKDGGKNWAENMAQVEENELRNDYISDHAKRFVDAGKTTMILTKTTHHGKRLKEMIDDQYPEIEVEYMDGDTSKSERDRIKQEMEEGKKKLCIASKDLVSEGFDMPALDVLQNAWGAEEYSKISTLQAAGRVMRVKENKEQPLIIEYRDTPQKYAEHILSRRTHYQKCNSDQKGANAFQFDIRTQVEPDYKTLEKGDDRFSTKQERIDWVNQFIDPDWSTNTDRYQQSEVFKYKRQRGEIGEIKNVRKVLSKQKTRQTGQTAFFPENYITQSMTKKQLMDVAQARDVSGRSTYKKDELKRALKYQDWGWSEKDTQNAKYLAEKEMTNIDNILEKAHKQSIKADTGLNPSEMLTHLKSKKQKDLLK